MNRVIGANGRPASIRRRLVWTVSIASFAIVLLSFVGLWLGAAFALSSYTDLLLVVDAGAIAVMTQRNGDRVETVFRQGVTQTDFAPGPHASYYQVWAEDGRVIARSPSLGSGDLVPPQGIPPEDVDVYRTTLPDGRKGKICVITWSPQTPLGTAPPPGAPVVRVGVASGNELVDYPLRALGVVLLVVGATVILVTTWIVRRAVRGGLAPLDAMGRQLQDIGPNRLDLRFDVAPLPAEMQPIGARLNDLFERLQRAFDRERRFASNAAHELRTPIAEIRAMSEVALAVRPARDEVDTTLAGIVEVSSRMQTVLETLLSMARQAGSRDSRQLAPVDIAALLRSMRDERLEKARAAGLDWPSDASIAGDASVVIDTDTGAMRSIVANLVDNALLYTPRGGSLTLSLAALAHDASTRSGVELTVSNRPVPLTPADLAPMFEPFWRRSPAGADEGHAGLGLALVRVLVTALNGSIDARLEPNERLVMTVHIPSAAAQDAREVSQDDIIEAS